MTEGPAKSRTVPDKPTPDTYWLLEGVSLLVLNALGGLYVVGEDLSLIHI